MTRAYILTTAAEADLRAVIRHTRGRWGEVQARRYVGQLRACAGALATGSGAYRNMDDLHPGLRMVHCEHHYIFCLPRPEAPALIVAILHERMDLLTRIAGRLQ